MKYLFRPRVLISLCLLGSALFTSVKANARLRDPISPAEQSIRLDELRHTPWDGRYSEKKSKWRWRCKQSYVKIMVEDPATLERTPVELQIVRPRSSRPVPVVIIVPTISGKTLIDTSSADTLCKKGMASIIADINDTSQPKVLPSWEHEDRVNRFAVLALRTVIDFAEGYRYFDRDRIGMLGTSLGGINASLMAGVEAERLKAIVITVGGGNLPYTLAWSDNSTIRKLRDARMKAVGMTRVEEYEDKLHEVLRYDPHDFADRVYTDRILMVLAKKDVTVPYGTQWYLHKSFGNPQYLLLNTNHVKAIVATTYLHFEKVVRFLRSRFTQPRGKESWQKTLSF